MKRTTLDDVRKQHSKRRLIETSFTDVDFINKSESNLFYDFLTVLSKSSHGKILAFFYQHSTSLRKGFVCLSVISHSARYIVKTFPITDLMKSTFNDGTKFKDRKHIVHDCYELYQSDLLTSQQYFHLLSCLLSPDELQVYDLNFYLACIPGCNLRFKGGSQIGFNIDERLLKCSVKHSKFNKNPKISTKVYWHKLVKYNRNDLYHILCLLLFKGCDIRTSFYAAVLAEKEVLPMRMIYKLAIIGNIEIDESCLSRERIYFKDFPMKCIQTPEYLKYIFEVCPKISCKDYLLRFAAYYTKMPTNILEILFQNGLTWGEFFTFGIDFELDALEMPGLLEYFMHSPDYKLFSKSEEICKILLQLPCFKGPQCLVILNHIESCYFDDHYSFETFIMQMFQYTPILEYLHVCKNTDNIIQVLQVYGDSLDWTPEFNQYIEKRIMLFQLNDRSIICTSLFHCMLNPRKMLLEENYRFSITDFVAPIANIPHYAFCCTRAKLEEAQDRIKQLETELEKMKDRN